MPPTAGPLPVEGLDALLRQTLGTDFQINHAEWKPLTNPGDNFGSVILAIDATITRNNKQEVLHLVAKLPPPTAYLLDLFNSPVTFKKELHFYSHVAKEFVNLQLESGVQEQDLSILAPKYFGGRLGLRNHEEFDEQATIILENLKYSNYSTEDRITGFDEAHTKFAIKELAKLHAMTIALKMKKPQFFEKVVLDVVKQSLSETAHKCVIGMIRKAQDDITKLSESKPYLDRLNKTIEYGIQMNTNAKKPEEPWATLVHNDFWVNNMMFRHNEHGDVVDMKIVDFQLCMYDYGVKDLIFFLVSSAKKDVLDNNLNDMFDFYYESFVKCLRTLKVETEKFSKSKYNELVNYCAPIKFNQCIMMVQVIKASRESATEMDNIKGGEDFLNVNNDLCNQKLLHIVSLFDKNGWLIN